MTDPKADKVLFHIKGDVATLTLNIPSKHNAFDDEIIEILINHLEEISAHNELRALVLMANGKNFSAGADLSWMKRMANLNYDENLKDATQLAKLMKTLNDLPIPTVARVQGAAYGGAIGLIACCDIAISADDSKFCLSEVKLGLAPATIAPYVIGAMGSRRCRQLFLTAEVFSAQQACNWGLVHETVVAEKLDASVEQKLSALLSNGPFACKAAKKLIRDVANSRDLTRETSELIAALRVSEEGQEGLSSFFEKRQPSWQSNID